MSDASPALVAIVHDVMERHTHVSADGLAAAIEDVFSRLRDEATSLVGHVGFVALVGRAVRLSSQEYPWLLTEAEDRVSFPQAGWQLHVDRVGAESALAGATALATQTLCLFVSFIGDDLVVRLAERAWAATGRGRDPMNGDSSGSAGNE